MTQWKVSQETSTETRKRLSLGSVLKQTGWSLPMIGMPWDVPVPKKVTFSMRFPKIYICAYIKLCNFISKKQNE